MTAGLARATALPAASHARIHIGPETGLLAMGFGAQAFTVAKTVEAMGFSEAEHSELFHRVVRGDNGSLAFQLTETPLDVERPGDLEALKAAYAAFPGVGGCDPNFRIAEDEDMVGGAA